MSVKHVKDYYNQLYSQYLEMEDDIKDLSQAVSNHIVMPEVLDQAVKELDKVKENYQRINYIMFLLDMPNKKEKQRIYQKRTSAVIKNIPESAKLNSILDENKKCLAQFSKKVDEINHL